MNSGDSAGMRDVRVEHDGGDPSQMIDRGLRHGCAGVGTNDKRTVGVAADQHVDGRKLGGVIVGKAIHDGVITIDDAVTAARGSL